MASEKEKLKLVCLNVNGLNDKIKRNTIISYLNQTKSDIILLQETHASTNIENTWAVEWPTKHLIFNNGTTQSKGVLVAINKSLNHKIISTHKDNSGRLIILEMEINSKKYTIGNIYMPTQSHENEQVLLLNKMNNILSELVNENIIIGGDLNIHLDTLLDSGNLQNKKTSTISRKTLINVLNNFDLCDIIRLNNIDKKLCTWSRGIKYSRLDYFLISTHLMNYKLNCSIEPSIMTDHKLIKMEIVPDENIKFGEGTWKLNTSLMFEEDFKHIIIDSIKESEEMLLKITDRNLTWEMIKSQIRMKTIKLGIKLKKEKDTLEKKLN